MKKFKLLLVGHSGAGKTSILSRYIDGSFCDQYSKTVGLNYMTKFVSYYDDKVQLDLWDTTGDPLHRDIVISWYKNADAILIVCDLSRRLYNIVLREVLLNAPINALIYIVGNKLDISSGPFFEGVQVSSKTGENINSLFDTVVRDLLEREYARDATTAQHKPWYCCLIL